jgi:large subunit ribosomal protein L25
MLWELEIECLPTEIPEKIEVEVEKLEIGGAIHVKDLIVPSSIKVLNDPEAMVVAVEPPRIEEVKEEAPPEEVAAEPELIRKEREGKEEAEAPQEQPKEQEGKKEESKEK